VRAIKRGVSAIERMIEAESVNRLGTAPKAGLTTYVREIELIEILDRIARSQLDEGPTEKNAEED